MRWLMRPSAMRRAVSQHSLSSAVLLGLALVMPLACDSTAGNNGNGDGGGGDNDGGMSGGDDEGMGCGTQSAKVELAPLDMLIALDTSFSMDFDNKWPSVKTALEAFAADPRFTGLGVGLQYFPLRAQCNVADYQVPAVGIAPLPGVAMDLTASLANQRMSGGTPMVPALEGTLAYSRSWAATNPGHKTVIVLATDGVPDDSCSAAPDGGASNTLANVVAVAASGLAGANPVSTFVIGVGSELTGLDQIAAAGGTQHAILVDTAQDIEQAFIAALNAIRKTALACEYAIPMDMGSAIDPGRVNVRFTSGGKSDTFVNVGDASGCMYKPTNGWYYDDPNNPQKVILCGDTCTNVKASDDGQVDVVFGCKTLIL